MNPSGEVVTLDGCANPVVDVDKVNQTRRLIVTVDDATRMAEIYELLAAPHRVRVLSALMESGEACACELHQMVDLPPSAMTRALQLLRSAGVISARRDRGRQVFRLSDGHMRLLMDAGREHQDHALEPPHPNL